METKDTIYVIELKFNKSAQEALDQINNKHYADAFALRGKTVEKIGMNFMIDEDKTIVLDWVKYSLSSRTSSSWIGGSLGSSNRKDGLAKCGVIFSVIKDYLSIEHPYCSLWVQIYELNTKLH